MMRRVAAWSGLILFALGAAGCAQTSAGTVDQAEECDVRSKKVSAQSSSSAGAAVERVTYREQVRGAEVIVVGTVKSSSVKSMHGANEVALPLRTTTFTVDCALRGHKVADESVEITEVFGEDHAGSLTVGGTYLVFAEHRTLLGEYPRLVPMGAAQGIYPVDNRGRAFNEPNGRHDLAKVVREVGAD